MAIQYHPKRGTILVADFDQGFKRPEMVKKRLCVVVSPPIEHRVGLCTVVPLSKSEPHPKTDYHYEFEIQFQLPTFWGNDKRWAKCDMVCAVGFHRLDLLRLGKDRNGGRIYQLNTLSSIHMSHISNGILASIGVAPLTTS
ncbi:type II toxin-antitoxin system PemK/MazF family toxin [Arenibacterium sp. LLYu02]|uniref:type II toxin-antitoxin system PemK/MazF family toxin n=1 Tax=Arenibacterium sp. LLYu02 TaxID=3404132 RepID=UPI003B212DD4